MVLRILHPILASTLCAANPLIYYLLRRRRGPDRLAGDGSPLVGPLGVA